MVKLLIRAATQLSSRVKLNRREPEPVQLITCHPPNTRVVVHLQRTAAAITEPERIRWV